MNSLVAWRWSEQTKNANDNWEITENDPFAIRFCKKITRSGMLHEYGQSQNLCGRCSKINLSDQISLSELQAGVDSCNLCNMLSNCLKRHSMSEQQEILLLKSRRIVRICAVQGRLISRYFSICIRLADYCCNGVVVDERTLCSAVNNSVRQVGIR